MGESIKIDIWSDIACPWCYIGKRKLEDAIGRFEALPEAAPVEIEYHSFELAPDTPVDFEGSEVDFLVGHKRLPEAQVKEMLGSVTSVARSVGLEYDFSALQHTNTVKAHELLHYAKEHGKQLQAKERLLRAYFIEGRHIGHVDELAQLAAEIGLDPQDVRRSLDEDEHRPAVRADQELAARLGINAVPFFVIDGRYGVSGAQRPETFLDALRQAAAHKAEDEVVAS
ncbi:MAG TPA: DsbA family oxidoreductase [Acidimicrobiales bacterium]